MDRQPEKKEPMGASGVSALIILFLACLSVIYRLFSINIDFINPIIEMIDDASAFFSFVCLSFIVVNFAKVSPKTLENFSRWDTILHITDIVLLNRLYSNNKLLSIYQSIIGLNRYYIAFIIAIVLVSFFLFPVLKDKIQKDKARDSHSSRRRNREKPVEKPTSDQQNDPANKEGTGDDKSKPDAPDNNKTADPAEETVKLRHYIFAFALSAIVALIVFCLADYWIVSKGDLNIDRPPLLSEWPNLGYIGVVVGSAIVAAFIAFTVYTNVVRKYKHGFNWTALWAVALEIIVIYAANRADISNWSDTLFSYLTNDIFSFVIYGILLFMIFQIGFTVFFDLFKHKENKNKITTTLEGKIAEIENTIVELACGLLSGCLDLFQFIPSFFDTIGVLLLDNPPKDTNQKPGSGEGKTKTEMDKDKKE